MIKRSVVLQIALLVSGFLMAAFPTSKILSDPGYGNTEALGATPSAVERKVYAPYNVPAGEAAIFWFGHVTLAENYADVRIRYTDESLLVDVGIIDRLLWYDPSPVPEGITGWDSVSLYVSQRGNVDEALVAETYRFDLQLDWWESDRSAFQAAYYGDGRGWILADLAFTTGASWNGNAPNDAVDDRGWHASFEIPFASLGLAVPPSQGTVWGLALAVHDRDSAEGPPLADQVWPEAMTPDRPATWGSLVFGDPPVYEPPEALPGGTLTVRQGLDGAVVMDADVGGSSVCGSEAGPDFFPTWGELNYAGKAFVNIQHVGQISEWPCYAKYYVTFPLDALPADKVLLSATLTLYHFGNAGVGWDSGPKPSYIEVLTVGDAWEESTLTWNNAPLALENVGGIWMDPLAEAAPWPGIPRQWDVSGAVADAYEAGEPLRLALYSPDWPFHSGKYFYSSDVGGDGEGRPTLTIAWGHPVITLAMASSSGVGQYGDAITYTLHLTGNGAPLVLVNTLPFGLGGPEDLVWSGTSVSPTYDPDTHTLTWQDSPAAGNGITLTYRAKVETRGMMVLTNSALLRNTEGVIRNAATVLVVNPYNVYLPSTLRMP